MQPFKDDTRRQARRPSHGKQAMTTSRIFSHNLPDRLKDDHDAQVDFTAPPGGTGSRNGQMHYMQQSVFSMLAAVGSKSDFRARFDESSDSDEQDEEKPRKPLSASTRPRVDKDDHSAMQSTGKPQRTSGDRGRRHRRSISEHELSHPFSSLEGHVSTEAPSSTEIPRAASPTRPRSATPTAVPVLSRMVEARANLDTGSNPTAAGPPSTENEASQQQSASPLSLRLKDMFGFETPEKIRAEYPCSLLQSILLQGYMYITEGHLCFYAYLPKKSTTVIKSGNLHKRGRKNPQYTRYWFSLKEDVLSYFADQSNLYFPSGHVDLRYGISASLADSNEKNKDVRDFQVTTDQNTYYFRADSAASAKEWVKALQKVIFRTHNEGNSVKISFPIENIIDIEESPMVEFAETMKIQIDDSFAIDEYYFTFFNFGREAFTFVKSLLGDPSAKSAQTLSPRIDGSKGKWMAQHEGGTSRRRSASASHISHGHDVIGPPRQQDSADSFAHSLDQATESSAVLQSMTDTNESASQILNRSDVFHSPTIQKLRRRSSADKAGHQHSDETAPPMKANNAGSNGPEIQFAGSESEDQQVSNMSTPALNDLVRAGAYPIQRAAGLAGYLRTRSMQMGTLLTSESMGYIEKVSGMWAGRHRHYGESESVLPDDQAVDAEDKTWGSKDGDRFRAHFALPSTERLQAAYYAHLNRVLPLYGKIYISQRKLCFRSLIYGVNTKMILPLKDIENVGKEKGFRFGYHGLVVVIRGHEELFFEFNTAETRDDCAVTLHQHLESVRFLVGSGLLAEQDKEDAEAAKTEHRMLQEARISTSGEDDSYMPTNDDSEELHPVFDDPRASIINFKPSESLRITCLTIGSRGDVQPYIALCKGLLAEGHRPKIATHAEFEPWVKKHGIDFAPVDGDPAELMRICVENGMFTYSFLREASMKFRGWIDDLLSSAWRGCQDSDLLIESPSAMAGIHIAEALQIPYFRAFTMPWTRTRTYPHAFAVPEQKMGGAYNYITYVMFDNVFWKAIAGQVNRWRKKELGLKATNLDRMKPNNVPFLYNFSPSVVPPPLDFPDWIRITGYWFLSEGTGWKPPHELVDFIQRARKDGKKIVYIGFGSIVVSDPSALTRTVVESVQKADVRCILSKGWSDRLGDPSSTKSEIPLPPEIYQIQAVPHDWLFSQIDAAAHHGGAGTTGASLRAGVPTIIKPFFGDQFFFGTRVEDLGVGICMNKLNVSVFSRALWEATHSERIIAKARDLGVKIRSEDGVNTAIQAIYRDLEYAKTLVKKRSRFSSTPFSPKPSAQDVAEQDIDEDAADSEEWTFIGDDTDIDISKRVRDRAISEADMLPGPVSCSMG